MHVGGPCEGCELLYAGMPPPEKISNSTTISGPEEPGERMILKGTVLSGDGTTPAPGIIIYLYHTDATGRYIPAEGQDAGRRHGRLRGWVKSGPDGRFVVNTIRPAPYPDASDPGHIHPLVKEPGKSVYYIDAIQFNDDPLLTAEVRAKSEGKGGDLNISPHRNAEGLWMAEVVITLGLKVRDYR